MAHRHRRKLEARRYRKTRKYKNSRLLRAYGITYTEYEKILKQQGGVCAICGKKSERALFVDHDKQTGKIRGLLDKDCNVALGIFGDTQEGLQKAMDYLRKA